MKKRPFHTIYEDNHLLIVNKSAGILSQGDKTGDKSLVDLGKEYIKGKYNKTGAVFLGLTHRLDRPVSGAVILARTSKSLERINKLFRDNKIQKTYWAVVKKAPPKRSDKLVHWLVKDNATNTTKSFQNKVDNAQRAELSYRLIGRLNDHHLLEVKPVTGRPHQIRVQLSSIGCPIRGDVKYGFPKPNTDASINLHARRLYFEHPVKKKSMEIIAALPENKFWEQFLVLEKVKVNDKKLDRLI